MNDRKLIKDWMIGGVSCLILILYFFQTSCANKVRVSSVPSEANVHANGKLLGKTPLSFDERSGYHKEYRFRIEKEGYKPFEVNMKQNKPSKLLIPSTVGGAYCLLPFVCMLWGYQLPNELNFKLQEADLKEKSK